MTEPSPPVPMCLGITRDWAVVRVALSDGCIAFPDDREQDLCLQHLSSIEPREGIEVIKVYDQPALDWYKSTRGGLL